MVNNVLRNFQNFYNDGFTSGVEHSIQYQHNILKYQ